LQDKCEESKGNYDDHEAKKESNESPDGVRKEED